MQLSALSQPTGMLSIIELDGLVEFSDIFQLDLERAEDHKKIHQLLTEISGLLVQNGGQHAPSAISLEPSFSFDAYAQSLDEGRSKQEAEIRSQPGLVLSLDTSVTKPTDPVLLPELIPNWGVPEVRNNYGVAKLTLYYHPKEEIALKEKQFVAELHDYCRHEGIGLLLKLMMYTPAEESFSTESFQADQLAAVQEFRGFCDLLALQYPLDSLACATLTSELDIPWVVVGDGREYADFKDVVRDSIEAGAGGYMAGNVFWREASQFVSDDGQLIFPAISHFLQTTTRDRLLELTRIVNEFAEK